MGNIHDSESSSSESENYPETLDETSPERKRRSPSVLQWYDASDEEIKTPTTHILKTFVSKEEGQAFWKREGVSLQSHISHSRLAEFSPATFPMVESRSPTARFLHSRLYLKSPMSRCNQCSSGRRTLQKKGDADDDGNEERYVRKDLEESDEGSDEEDSSTQTTPTSSSLTSSAIKRQKKKEKKKARQQNKEKFLKQQRLQRAEAEKKAKQQAAAHKKMMAEYAAHVAKPTVSKKEVREQKEKTAATASHTATLTVVIGKKSATAPSANSIPHSDSSPQNQSSSSLASANTTTSNSVDSSSSSNSFSGTRSQANCPARLLLQETPAPTTPRSRLYAVRTYSPPPSPAIPEHTSTPLPRHQASTRVFGPSSRTSEVLAVTSIPRTRQDSPIIRDSPIPLPLPLRKEAAENSKNSTQKVSISIQPSQGEAVEDSESSEDFSEDSSDGEVEEEEKEKQADETINDQEPEEDAVEGTEEFEILFCGERRKVKPFTPRKHRSSTSTVSGDEQEIASSGSEPSAENSPPSGSSSRSVYDIPEHSEPVVVPFREAPAAPQQGLTALIQCPAVPFQRPSPHPQGPASHLQGSAPHLQGSAPHLQGSASHLQGPAPHLQGPASHLQAPATPLRGPAAHRHGPARTPLRQQVIMTSVPTTPHPVMHNHHYAMPVQQSPQVFFTSQPIMSSYGNVQPRYYPVGSPFAPVMYPSSPMISVMMSTPPMYYPPATPQRVMNVPVPIQVPQMSQPQVQQQQPMMVPGPGPPMMMPMVPTSVAAPSMAQQRPLFTTSRAYPGQRPLTRPVRCPLEIKTPPRDPQPVKEDKKEEPKESRSVATKQPEPQPMEGMREEIIEQESTEEPEQHEDLNAEIELPLIEAAEQRNVENAIGEITEQFDDLRTATSSPDLNGELITAGVAVVLQDNAFDDLPPVVAAPCTSFSSSQTDLSLSPRFETAQDEAKNRVFGFSKQVSSCNNDFDIWAGWMNEMPPCPEAILMKNHDTFEQMWKEDKKLLAMRKSEKSRDETKAVSIDSSRKTTSSPSLVKICKQMEPFFMNTRVFWLGSWIDSDKLRSIFKEALGESVPHEVWQMLQKVCEFQPGYIHIFDMLIGADLEFTYNFKSDPDYKKKDQDPLFFQHTNPSQRDTEDTFFQRFNDFYYSEILAFIPTRYITIRAFVAILEVLKSDDLSRSDLYYLADLVYGASDFYKRFNRRFESLQVTDTQGSRWIRQVSPVNSNRSTSPSALHMRESVIVTVEDFVNRMRPHIEDIVDLMPDKVINDKDFFEIVKQVLARCGEQERNIWESIVAERDKAQEFNDAFRSFMRMEFRRGSLYMKKREEEDAEEETEPLVFADLEPTMNLRSALKKPSSTKSTDTKKISYQPIPRGPTTISTQTDHFDMDQVWAVERELIRQLQKENISFRHFIQSDNAREMYQFLVDLFKNMDLEYFAYILEKAITEMREQSWIEVNDLRVAAEEAQRQLVETRDQHARELGDMCTRMERISRFETYAVQNEATTRIAGLRDRIEEMKEQRENLVREEVREEKAAMIRVMKEMSAMHMIEKARLTEEVTRLRIENSRVMTEADVKREMARVQEEQAEMAMRCESEMNKARAICENTSRLLRESQREIDVLRQQNERLSEDLQHHSLEASNLFTPEPEHDCVQCEPPLPSTPPPVPLSANAQRQLQSMIKLSAEIDAARLRSDARDLFERYNRSDANRKDRKAAEKQLRDFETALDRIESAIMENMELLRLNVVDGLVRVPDVPMSFSEKVFRKLNEMDQMDQHVAVEQHEAAGRFYDEDDCCLICYESNVSASSSVTCETCFRQYHRPCITTWIQINAVCPACNRALPDPDEFPSLGR